MGTSIAHRLEQLQISLKLKSQSELAKYLNVKAQEISDFKRGKVKKLSTSLYRALQNNRINPNWVESEEGDMMLTINTFDTELQIVPDSEMLFANTPNLSKMTIEEMKVYYKTLQQHEENKKRIEEIFKIMDINIE